MAHEAHLGLQWLVSVLANDTTLQGLAPGGVWQGMAPPGTATPFIVLNLQAGSDVTTMNAFRLIDDLVFQVRASGPASNASGVAAAAARIDQLIGSPPVSGTVTGGAILSSSRQSPIYLSELVAGELFLNVGGLYRLIIQQMS